MSDRFDLIELPSTGAVTIQLDGSKANIYAGGEGAQGDIALRDEQGKQTVHIDGGGANLTMGGEGHNADIRLLNASGELTIHLDAGTGDVLVGGKSLQPADFVFAADYPLPSLGDVRSFIRQHGHLPSLRSGGDMKEAGVNLGEFVMKLLQKVEELTLYVIKQEDVIQQQQRRVEQIEKRVRP
jgi:hypothetical protein